MTKYEWEKELRNNLKRLPEYEIAKVLDYYNELFEDKADAGLSEREIVKQFGNPFDVAYKILYDSGAEPGGAETVKPPEPFVAYEKNKTKENPPRPLFEEKQTEKPPNSEMHAEAPQKKEQPAGTGGWIARLVFFIPFFVLAIVLWSLVIGFTAGAFGAVLGGAAGVIGGLIYYTGSAMLMAVFGAGIAAIGVGMVMSAAAYFIIKAAVRITQKYFYMGKHKTAPKNAAEVA